MSTNLRSTCVSQGKQMSTDSDSVVRGTDSQVLAKASIFHIQTGIRAGGPSHARAARQSARASAGL
jgi:hypothetical protein